MPWTRKAHRKAKPKARGDPKDKPKAHPKAKRKAQPKQTGDDLNHQGDDLMGYIGAAKHPRWAAHIASILRPFLQHLPQLGGLRLRLHLWSDCAGICSEMCSAPQVAAALRELYGVEVELILHGASDSCPQSKKFIFQNFDPKHWSKDIICDRNLTTGDYIDSKTDPPVICRLPSTGIDIYIAGWPCGPFSHKGERKREDDAKGNIIWAVINSIKLMNPAFIILENVSAVTETTNDDLWAKVREAFQQSLPNHSVVEMKGMSPLLEGYPNQRDLLCIVGSRNDVCTTDQMNGVLQTLLLNPLPPIHNWQTFLGFGQGPDWTKLHSAPTAAVSYTHLTLPTSDLV